MGEYINVNGNVKDPYYRYKMPRLIAKVEGSGNGIKTVISNMADIGKALTRPPTYPLKFFGCELGAQTQFDVKNDRYIVNGSHDSSKLQEILAAFIIKFVLCPDCDNPETDLKVKRGSIGQRCKACGYQGFIALTHRVTQFIIRNPPDMDPKAIGESKTKRKSRKEGKSAQHIEDTSDNLNDTVEDDDDGEWSVDVSADAVAERMKALTEGAKSLTLTNDLEQTQTQRLQTFFDYVKKLKADDQLIGNDKQMFWEADRLDIKDKGPLVLVEVLLDEDIIKQLKLYRNHFLRLTMENPKAQKYLLGGLEQLCGNVHPEKLLPKVAAILKAMYDLDLVEEEVFHDWGSKPSKKYVSKEISQQIHDKAAPFLKWLKEAEEDSSEEEEDEEVEISFSNRSGNKLHVEKVESGKKEAKPEEDEIDIDDI
ncbi:eukaryotic translation initiation factor 5-like [Apostichopus japonicus]|uniref:eukaryotic translation initiation factor 5-like n=1 Tax=Stichopus japonicus TaxID=307972 RepID=UPI003AB14C57